MTHVRKWTVDVFLFEDNDKTTANAELKTEAGNVVRGVGTAHRSGSDPVVPEIGAEFAAGRALRDLARKLMGFGVDDLQSVIKRP